MNHCISFIILLVTISSSIIIASEAQQPKVTIPNIGTVYGRSSLFSKNVAVYNGIPYAKPPINDLRWQPPQPMGKFGDLNATEFGAVCMQFDFHNVKPITSEDCLFLNVASPMVESTNVNKSPLPVMVWIHGGAYVDGSSNLYTPDTLVARSNNSIIAVTLNYRLNIFGFLGGDDIQKRSNDGSAGNFGIQDQRLAIQWVKDNIAAFGGNGDDITIFGESAGGNSVFNHLTQKASFPLYKKAIIESGVYNEGAFSFQHSNTEYIKAKETTLCPTLDCMLSRTSKELLDASGAMAAAGFSGWGPVVDGVSLSDTPENLITNNNYNNKVPIIIGSNRDELAFFTIKGVKNNLNEAELNTILDAKNIKGAKQEEMKELYSRENYTYPKKLGKFSFYWWQATRIGTDFVPGLGACGVRNIAKKLVKGKSPKVFSYLFAHPTQSANDKLPGCGPNATTVGHATEIVYVYNDVMLLQKGEEADLASSMSLYWITFAKTGNPNNAQYLPANWPLYTVENDEVLRFDTKSDRGVHIQSRLRKKQCDFQEMNRFRI